MKKAIGKTYFVSFDRLELYRQKFYNRIFRKIRLMAVDTKTEDELYLKVGSIIKAMSSPISGPGTSEVGPTYQKAFMDSYGEFFQEAAREITIGIKNFRLEKELSYREEKLLKKTEMARALRKAIVNDELVVYYQPQIEANSGKIKGVEALVRWKHPKKGLISPVEFIPIAEDAGLIVPIGDFVLREAIKQQILWSKSIRHPLSMSVNLSACQFQQGNLLNTVDGLIKEFNVDPSMLEFEITESTLIKDVEHTIYILKKLLDMGIKTALDDFGTGYSSLSYLTRLPISTIKIDKTFIDDIGIDESETRVLVAILELAQCLKLSVVAEGVENKKQLQFLREHNCDKIQGYYYGRPMEAKDIEEKYLGIYS